MDSSLAAQPLWGVPFLPSSSRPKNLYLSEVTRPILHAWDNTAISRNLTTFPSPITPIVLNPDFTPGMDHRAFQHWTNEGTRSIGHFFDLSGPIPFHTFRTKHKIPKTERYRYFQIRHWVTQKETREGAERKLTLFERWLLTRHTDAKLTSDLYRFTRRPITSTKSPGQLRGKQN